MVYFHGEVTLHVLHRKAILFRHHLYHILKIRLLFRDLDNLVREQAYDLVFVENHFLFPGFCYHDSAIY